MDLAPDLARALAHSRYAQRLLAAEPRLADALAAGLNQPFGREAMIALLAERKLADEASLKAALRALRKQVYLRLIARDLLGLASLEEVMSTVTTLAEVCITHAAEHLDAWLAGIHGEPIGSESGVRQTLIVVAMGKLGGGELNVSSDVDLVYVYPEDGNTRGPRRVSNHEYFTRLGQKLSQALSDLTPEGYVFRVDTRLRPWGESGPLVTSLAALEAYFLAHGREWERYAWLKARPLTGDETQLMALVHPFVYRKYLDYDAIAALRGLHAQIRREVVRRDLADNIKLGPGGIREIEFVAQVFQLIRGGKDPLLKVRATRTALELLRTRRLLPDETVDDLQAAYAFLRRLEHRLQYLDDAQTHMLPASEEDRQLIAETMDCADWAQLLTRLDAHRARVEACFQAVFAEESRQATQEAALWAAETTRDEAIAQLAELGFKQPEAVWEALQRLRSSARYQSLPEASRARFDRLVPMMLRAAAGFPDPEATLARMLTLLETIARRRAYLALLVEYPASLTQLARVCSASPWAADYLTRHPVLLDELLDPAQLLEEPDWRALADALRAELGEGVDPERQMDVLRHFKHAWTFRILARDLEGRLPIEKLADELTALADLLLAEVLRLCWLGLPRRHREDARFAIIGYGKLGGREMGYASDLDIVFLYDDPAQAAQETYSRLAARINTWLTTLTPAGVLYETDLRLRPDGASGLLVSAIDAFRDYQEHHAWTWEHQALTRARYVAGDPAVGARFEAIRRDILCRRRDLAKLREDVLAMRDKMLKAHPNDSGLFDLKHDPGGLIDVEFMVQFLILAHAHRHGALADNVGNLALLKRAADAGLIAADAARQVQTAYRTYRRLQHNLRMKGASRARVPLAQVAEHVQAVTALWRALFGAPPANPLK
ncbi:bifunctional [glutamate--ammonia ligase]-adenylyl-L-tyrosine phosphorylase/[glutamate--ammonia-ligase] adenylyltransferase [Thiobacter aerophilum]|uniref:Bifunctional glutamine synthetase adenylyltransferase/adenylyl-removing enzyme n=1 Tax=Thiobacter aerophilum TaxID=3121275 RepID=A0ABV0EEA6_9BURK